MFTSLTGLGLIVCDHVGGTTQPDLAPLMLCSESSLDPVQMIFYTFQC